MLQVLDHAAINETLMLTRAKVPYLLTSRGVGRHDSDCNW